MKCICCNKKLHRRKGIRIQKYYYCKECIDILNYVDVDMYNFQFTAEYVDNKIVIEKYEGEI